MPEAATSPFRVAIVGGGLGGIALGVALQRRQIPFQLYEARSSFTEIGAGINLGPQAVRTLRAIDASLGEQVSQLATRNPPPHDHVWMDLRYGAAWGAHADGELFHRIACAPTGNMTVHRQELLAVLAAEMGAEGARFRKKLDGYVQTEAQVVLQFSDGTRDTASVLVACDGIHSRVRACMLGAENAVSQAAFGRSGVYRAVVPMDKAVEAIGESARHSTVMLMPGGYLITYPISGGTKLNCGALISKPTQTWPHSEWTLPNQGHQFQQDCKNWGPRAQKILSLFDPDPAFWAIFQHTRYPQSFVDGRVILTGDAAHSMPPHQGAGASQALEDAYVLAEALAEIANPRNTTGETGMHVVSARHVKAALRAVEEVRVPRFATVHRYSTEAGDRFFGLWEQKLEGEALREWIAETERRLRWIWDGDMAVDAARAKDLIREQLLAMERTE